MSASDYSVLTPDHPLARGRNIVIAALVSLLVLIFWRSVPELDIAISAAFFTPEKCGTSSLNSSADICGSFSASFDPLVQKLRGIGLRVPQILFFVVLGWGLYNLVRGYDPAKRFWQAPVIALFSIITGPIATVNFFLKAHGGRARPYQLDMFGAQQPFTLPGDFVDNCAFNCSFPSGEAAGATWLLFIIPFLPRPLRWPVFVFLVVFIITVSVLRIAVGRHFASDVSMGISLTLVFLAIGFWIAARVPGGFHRLTGNQATL